MPSIRYIYVAGPLTGKDLTINVHKAARVAEELRQRHFIPYCPHLSILMEMICPGGSYEDYLAMDFAWIDRCDALFRLPGESAGADREVEYAKSKGIPVYYSLKELPRSTRLI